MDTIISMTIPYCSLNKRIMKKGILKKGSIKKIFCVIPNKIEHIMSTLIIPS